MDVGRICRPWAPEEKGLITHSMAGGMGFVHIHLPSFLSPSWWQVMWKGSPGGAVRWVCVTMRTYGVWAIPISVKGVARNLLNLCRIGGIFIILLKKKHLPLPLQNMRHNMFSGHCYTNILEKDSPWQNLTWHTEKCHGNCLPKRQESGMTLASIHLKTKDRILYNTEIAIS